MEVNTFKIPLKLKVTTLISVIVSFQVHLLEYRAKTTEIVSLSQYLQAALYKTTTPAIIAELNWQLCANVSKKQQPKLHIGSLTKLVFGGAFIRKPLVSKVNAQTNKHWE